MSAFKSDHQLVRDYITAQDHLQYSLLPEDVVAVLITHSNLSANHLDIRFNLHTTIAGVKERLHKHVGTPAEHQRLVLKRNGSPIAELADNSRMLGFYSPLSGDEIHIIDTDPFSLSRGGGLTDVSLVQKYRMTDEEYEKRSGTLRDYIKKQRELDPMFKLKAKGAAAAAAQASSEPEPDCGPESVAGINVGQRCEVMPGARRGVVCFVGEIEGLKAGFWVGVRLDEPVGKNDGTVKGNRIFECPAGFGSLVRGRNVTTGDFPERDLMDEEEEEEGACGCGEGEDCAEESNSDDEI